MVMSPLKSRRKTIAWNRIELQLDNLAAVGAVRVDSTAQAVE